MVSRPFSTATFTSSFLISGNSVLMTYSLSSSVMSTKGAHSATVMDSSFVSPSRAGVRPKKLERRFCSSSISLDGSERVIAFIFSDLLSIPAVCFARRLRPPDSRRDGVAAPIHFRSPLQSPQRRAERLSSTQLKYNKGEQCCLAKFGQISSQFALFPI